MVTECCPPCCFPSFSSKFSSENDKMCIIGNLYILFSLLLSNSSPIMGTSSPLLPLLSNDVFTLPEHQDTHCISLPYPHRVITTAFSLSLSITSHPPFPEGTRRDSGLRYRSFVTSQSVIRWSADFRLNT